MAARQRAPLRPLTEAERQVLPKSMRATSERVDQRQRAHALLAVADGATFSTAARQAG